MSNVSPPDPGRAPKSRPSAGLVHAAATLALLLFVAFTALTATPTPPPAIAEFAPQPFKQTTQVQAQLSSSVGKGQGGVGNGPGRGPGHGPGGAVPVPVQKTTVVHAGSRFTCIGDPPRQIEDPQSPPCVPPYTGNNGGATSTGVSKDKVRIFLVHYGGDAAFASYRAFFNARFQFYNRNIELVPSDVVGSGNEGGQTNDEPGQRALADGAAANNVFGSTYWTDNGGYYYTDELARKNVVSVVNYETPLMKRDYQRYAPYAYGYTMNADDQLDEIGSWICARFAHKKAVYAGIQYQSSERKFGIILRPSYDDNAISTATLDAQLAGCGVHPFYARYPSVKGGTPDYDNTLQQMSNAKVTSVLCLCWYVDGNNYLTNASSQGYQPEWLLTSFGAYDDEWNFRWATNPPADQTSHVLGLSFHPRVNTLANEPFWWAMKAVDPAATPPTDLLNTWYDQQYYREMLLLASGIQMAGPNLTPATFARGLQAAHFPNPDTALAAGHVGFNGGSYTMTVDAAEYWYSATTKSPYPGDGAGALCWVDRGRRRGPNDWAAAKSEPSQFQGTTCDTAR
jgi:hypothetical protein